MRRKDKEITDSKEIRKIIKDAIYCNVAMCQNNTPYLVPMNFGFQEDFIYLHSVNEGWKIDILKENPQVCIEIVQDVQFIKSLNICRSSMKYNSVLIFGKAEFILDQIEKKKALGFIVSKYNKNIAEDELKFSDYDLGRLTVLKVKMEKVTGKKSE
ncbi:MAG: Putative flavin-nucleotide-binding protein [candidate division TA06 bacterium 34_109]|uniref:Putative flavin-nucleotide-binding protein n=1 Tax=candidate division TA06 bacterium 34_109 TaxID=1635277 RepID=A0A101HYQ9_UNCT6|nr:MAG: Putative flavin-nucleotide-binding protein [candidate division TA06 bacterium 34_109]